MIAVLTHHWAKSDLVTKARAKLDGNGLAQSKAPGFISRQTLLALDDPLQITSVVVWETSEIYDAWKSSAERAKAMAGAEEFWSRPPESQRFDVAG